VDLKKKDVDLNPNIVLCKEKTQNSFSESTSFSRRLAGRQQCMAANAFVALALPLQYRKSRRDYNVERRHLGISLLDKSRGQHLLGLVQKRIADLEERMSDDSAASSELDDMEDDLEDARDSYVHLVAEPVHQVFPLNHQVLTIDQLDDQNVGTDFRFRSKVRSHVITSYCNKFFLAG